MSIEESLINPTVSKKQKTELLKKQYREWRLKKKADRATFFPVFSEFVDHLNDLSPGAVKMYVFIGLKSSNMEGESFYDIAKMAEFLGVSTRTVSSWIKELEEKNFIARYQLQTNGVARTFLRPIPELANGNA